MYICICTSLSIYTSGVAQKLVVVRSHFASSVEHCLGVDSSTTRQGGLYTRPMKRPPPTARPRAPAPPLPTRPAPPTPPGGETGTEASIPDMPAKRTKHGVMTADDMKKKWPLEDWIPPQRKESLAQPRSSSSTRTPSAGEPPTTKQDNKSNPRQYAEELKKQWPATFWRLPQEEDGPEAEGNKGQGAEAEEACEEEVASRILDPAREEGRAEAEEVWSSLLPGPLPLPLPQLPPLPPPPHPVVGAHVRLQHCTQHPTFDGKEGYLIERADDGRWHMALVKEMFGFHLRYVKEINFEVLQRPIDEAPPTQQPKVVKAKFPMCEPRHPVRVPPTRRP